MARFLSLVPRVRDYMPSEDLFDRFFEDWNMPSLFSQEERWVPAFDITENDKEYVVTAELPGMDSKDVDVSLSEGILSVKGEKKHEKEEKKGNVHRFERRFGAFHRSFRIPGKVEVDKVDANFKDGILTLTLPKAEGTETKKIEVK